jgi:hypothetical protein
MTRSRRSPARGRSTPARATSTTRRSTIARVRRRSPTRRCDGQCESAAAPSTPPLAYKLTIRRGSKVDRESFDDLNAAIEAAERHAAAARRDGALPAVSAFRDFEPGDRVSARLEISTGGLLRGRSAGVDVMGDGSLVAFRGGITRRDLEPRGRETHFDALKRELGGLS